ncbi:MAG: hypothetical protein E7813_05085 [Bradyrhizobium sp.]|uniref:hypothetical protein n=1 Tax=Bradyrhizobium sp. TaxID=376 RepID=UPI0012014B25|nr:hypothetical protein [Bradyrhizobium sp.]THD71657.1 MAG: hypothetical protein E7813_05085 [Bradyrhizobium sp.]
MRRRRDGAASPRRAHRSWITIDEYRADEKSPRESVAAIRAKMPLWRAAMTREAGERENFFIAKIHDSESAQRVFDPHRYGAMMSRARHRSIVQITKTSVAQAFSAFLIIAGAGFWRVVGSVMRMRCCVVDRCASCAPALSRKYFLKQDAVFFNVLVYSGCSAFDSRVHAAIKPSH